MSALRTCFPSALGCALAIVGCQPTNSSVEHEHGHVPERPAWQSVLELDPAVIETAGIQTEPARPFDHTSTLVVAGELRAIPDRTRQVAARIPGVLEEVDVHEGAHVNAGQLVAVVRAPSLGELRSSVAVLRARVTAERARAKRTRALADRKLAPEAEAIATEAEAAAMEAQAKAASQRLRTLGVGKKSGAPITGLEVRAPASGVVVSRTAVVGQPVLADDVLAHIVDVRELWFEGHVAQNVVARITRGAEAKVTLRAFPGLVATGQVEYAGPLIEHELATAIVRVRLANSNDELRVGLYGEAIISLAPEHETERVAAVQACSVPRSAVIDIHDRAVVFVKRGPHTFEAVEVVVGRGSDRMLSILQGIQPGDELVVDGVFTLKSIALRGTFGEDHE